MTLSHSGWGVRFFDFDSDGWKDLLVAQGHDLDTVELNYPNLHYRETMLLARNNGKGFVDVSAESGGFFHEAFVGRGLAIGDIDNDGRVIKDPCRYCSGSAASARKRPWRSRSRRASTTAPHPPVGRGRDGHARRARRDLYVFLSVKPHRFFQRDGADLQCRVPITMRRRRWAARSRCRPSTGRAARSPSPPAPSRASSSACAARHVDPAQPSRGDLYIEVSVETPVKLTKRQKELLQEFEREGGSVPERTRSPRLLRQGEGIPRRVSA